MVIAIVIEGMQDDDVHARVDPLAELSSMLHAITHADHHPRVRELRERIHDEAHEELRSIANRFRPLFGAIRARYFFPLDTEVVKSLSQRFDDLRKMPVDDFVRHSVTALLEFRTESVEDVTTNEGRVEIYRKIERLSMSRLELAKDVVERPDETLAQLVAFLERVNEVWFEPEWRSMACAIDRAKREFESALSREGRQAIRTLSPAAHVLPDPARVVFDKVNRATVRPSSNGLIVVPSYFTDPHLIVKHDAGLPVVIHYGVGSGTGVSMQRTTRRLSALADPVRLEICRAILRHPRTTVDLAIKMRMTEPQVSRHLRVLRETDLVVSERRGKLVYYALDRKAIQRIGPQLLALLHR